MEWPEVIDGVHHHTTLEAPGPGFGKAVLQAAPEGIEGELFSMGDQEMRRNPEVKSRATGSLSPSRHCQGCFPHGLAAIQKACTEQEGFDESFERDAGTGPECFKTRGKQQTPALRLRANPVGIERSFQVGMPVDEGD